MKSFAALAFLGLARLAQASHFAYGTINWERLDPVNAPYAYTVTLELALRTSYFGGMDWSNFDPDNGVYTSTSVNGRLQWQPDQCDCPECVWDNDGNTYNLAGGLSNYGNQILIDCHTTTSHSRWDSDECYAGTNSKTHSRLYCMDRVTIEARVRYSDDDYFVGRMVTTITPPSLPMDGVDVRESRWRISFMGYARISSLKESNKDRLFQMQSVLDPALLSSPVSIGFPREYAGLNRPWTFQIPATSPTDRPLSYFITPTTDNKQFHSALQTTIPGTTAGGSGVMDVSRLSEGILTWTPTATGIYAVQFMIADDVGGYCPLDLMLEVIEIC